METTELTDGLRMYEGMFILKASVASKDWARAETEVRKLLDTHGAQIVSFEKWDERKLTYEIRKQNKGVYVLSYLRMPPTQVDAMKREVELSNLILRLLLLRSDGPPKPEPEPEEASEAEAKPEGDAPAAPPEGEAEKTPETPAPQEEKAEAKASEEAPPQAPAPESPKEETPAPEAAEEKPEA